MSLTAQLLLITQLMTTSPAPSTAPTATPLPPLPSTAAQPAPKMQAPKHLAPLPTESQSTVRVSRHGVANFQISKSCSKQAAQFSMQLPLRTRATLLQNMADKNCDAGYLAGRHYTQSWARSTCTGLRLKRNVRAGWGTDQHAYYSALYNFFQCDAYNAPVGNRS